MTDWGIPREPQRYLPHGDPYMQPVMTAGDNSASQNQNYMTACTTREQEELARRKAEHLESADHILPQQHSFAGYTGGGGRAPRVTPAALRENFHLPLTEVAKKFNMCTTAFKKACRKQGIMQWPHRTLRSLEKKIATLMAETKFTKETDAIAAQVRKLKAKQEAILSGKEVLGSDDDMFCVASPSDDSSTASAHSGNSSPGPSDSISHLGIDDSSSGGTPSSTSSAPPSQPPPQLNLSPQMEHMMGEQFSRQQQGAYPRHHHPEAFLQGVCQGGFQQPSGQQQQAYWSGGGGGGGAGGGAGGGGGSDDRLMIMAQENQSLRNIISNLTQESLRWMQRNDEAHAELVKYHAMCDELSSKLAEREGRDMAEMQQQQQQQQHYDGQRVADGMMDTTGEEEGVDGMTVSGDPEGS